MTDATPADGQPSLLRPSIKQKHLHVRWLLRRPQRPPRPPPKRRHRRCIACLPPARSACAARSRRVSPTAALSTTTLCGHRPHAPLPPPLSWVQNLDTGAAAHSEASSSSAAAAAAAALPREAVVARLHDVYAALLAHGFQRGQVERALGALPPATATTDAALDWLLLHLDSGELPKRFVDGGRALGPVELKHRGQEVTAAERAQRAAQQAEERGQAAAAAPPAAAALTAQQAAKKAEEESRAAQERRAWVMQYMDNSSESSGTESDDASAASSPGSAVEDWEVWGDPREVERRRVERARAALPLGERKAMVWQELQATKGEAAAAKASRDKERQRGLGDIIRQLKQELEAMGEWSGLAEAWLGGPGPPDSLPLDVSLDVSVCLHLVLKLQA